MLKWMRRRENQFLHLLEHSAVWLVIYRPPSLVLDHITLRVELLLRHGGQQFPHAVRFEPERKGELIGRNRLEIVRSLQPGRPVECPTRALNQLEVLIRSDVCRSLEEHVFEQVSESGSADFFIRRTDVVPEIDCRDWSSMVLGQRDK